jgi:antitoxin (DNA-binding transcriptional repressor) of toxin-antitoxin stability system
MGIESAIKMANFTTMNATFVNVGEFKDRLTEYLAKAEAGEEIVVCRRNVPMVKLELISARSKHANRSTPGSMKGQCRFLEISPNPSFLEAIGRCSSSGI